MCLCLHECPWTHHQSALFTLTCWWIICQDPVWSFKDSTCLCEINKNNLTIVSSPATTLWWHSLLVQNNPTVNAPPQCVIDCLFLFLNMKLFFSLGGSVGTNELWAERQRQEVRQNWGRVVFEPNYEIWRRLEKYRISPDWSRISSLQQ